MNCAFISGIPASGKSYLAAKVARELGIRHIAVDDWREEMACDPELKKWVNFFFDLEEEEYWRTTSPEEQWENIRKQSEAFWPTIARKIKEVQRSGEGTIFEGVNLLPHLVRKDLDVEGIVLLGESLDLIWERNRMDPRWGKTEELQKKEAEAFWYGERPRYQSEAGDLGGCSDFLGVGELHLEVVARALVQAGGGEAFDAGPGGDLNGVVVVEGDASDDLTQERQPSPSPSRKQVSWERVRWNTLIIVN